METILLSEELGIAAADIVSMMCDNGRFGREVGFACSKASLGAVQSDYVRIAGRLLDITIHVDRVSRLSWRTTHPFWVWIERNPPERSGV